MKKITLLYVMFLCFMITKTFSQTFTEIENNNTITNVLSSSQSRIHMIADYQGTVTNSDSDFWILSRKEDQATDLNLYFDRNYVSNNPNFDFRVWEYQGGNWGVAPVNIGTLRSLMQTSGVYNYRVQLPYSTNLNSNGISNNYYAIEVFTNTTSFNYNFMINGGSVDAYYYCYEFNLQTPTAVQVNDVNVTLNNLGINAIDDMYYIVKFSKTNSFTNFTDEYIQNQALPVKTETNSYNGSGEHIVYVGNDNGAIQSVLEMTNLQRNTTYYYKVYTYSDCNGYINYRNDIAPIAITTCAGTIPNVSTINKITTTSPTTATINILERPLGADSSTGYLVKFSDANNFIAPTSGTVLPSVSSDYTGKTGEQVVYTGNIGTQISTIDEINQMISGLQENKEYYLKVYTYDLCGGKYNFETTGSTVTSINYVCEEPTAVANVVASATGVNSMSLTSYASSNATNGTIGYVVKVSDTNSFTTPSAVPSSTTTTYNVNTGGEQVMYVGDSNTPNLNITGLESNTTYYVKTYAYNTCAGTDYFELSGSEVVTVTTCGAPIGNSQLATFREDLTWENRVSPIISNVPADITGHVVKMNIENSFVDITGVQSSLPTADINYSGADEQVILSGNFGEGQAFTGHNLLPNTEYFFKIYSYKECNGQYYFSETNHSTSKFTAGVSTKLASNALINNFNNTAFTLASFTEAPVADNGNGAPSGYIIKMNTVNSFTSFNFRDNLPVANANYGGGEQVVYVGSSITPNLEITGLTPNTTYYFSIYAYRDHGSPYFFKSYQQTGHEFLITNNGALENPTIIFDNISAQVGDSNFDLNATSNSTGTISYEIINDGGTGTTLNGTNNATVVLGNKAGNVIIKATQESTVTYQSAVKTIILTIQNLPATLNGFIGYEVNSGITVLDMDSSLNSNSTGAYSFSIIGPDLGYSINGNLLNVNNVAGSIIIKVTQEADANYGETVAYFSTLFYNTALTPKVPVAHNLFDFSLDVGESKIINDALNVFNTTVTYSIVNDGGTGSTLIGNVFTAGNTPGTVILRSSSIEDIGYLATSKDVTVTITGTLPQTITFQPLATKTYGDATFNLTGVSDSGLPISYISSNTSVATISGSTVTIVGAGSTAITALQGGNTVYDPATNVTQNLVVDKKMLVVSPKDATITYGILDLPADNSTENYPYQVTGLVNGDLEEDVIELNSSFTDISNLVIENISNPGQPLNVGAHNGVLTWGTPPILDLLSPNYTYRANVTGNLVVEAAQVIVNADTKLKSYDGDISSDPELTYTVNRSSLPVGTDVINYPNTFNFTGELTRNAGQNAGVYTINKGTLNLGNNYEILFNSADFTINKTDLTATSVSNKVYGDPLGVLPIQYSGFVNGENASVIDTSPTAIIAETVDETTPVAAPYIVNVSGGLDNNYNIITNDGTLTVTKRNLITVIDNQTKVYGESNPTFTVQYSNFVNGDDESVIHQNINYGAYESGSTLVDSSTGVGEYVISNLPGTFLADNYWIQITNLGVAKLTVTKKAIEVTANTNQSKEFGETDPNLTYVITNGSLVNGDSFTGNLNRDTGENVGLYPITIGDLTLNNNYDLSFVSDIFEIIKVNASVIINNLSQTYDGNIKPVSVTTTPEGLATTITYNGETIVPENAGTYTIKATINEANYNGTATEILTINKANQTITFEDLADVTYGDTSFNLNATSTSGLPVTYTSSNAAVATVVGNMVTIVGAGTTTITASQTGNINYNEALNVEKTFTVLKKTIEITADAQSKVYGNVDPSLTYQITSGSLVGSDVITGELTRGVGEVQGNYAITQGTLEVNPNYDLNFVDANFYIDYRFIRVVPTAVVEKTYGDADPGKLNFPFTITEGSLAFDDTIDVFGRFRDVGENVGSYQIRGLTSTFTSSNGGASSYAITYTHSGSARLLITPRSIEVTADAKNKMYGDSDPVFTYQITNGALQFNDEFTGALDRETGENIGNYVIQQGSLSLGNNYILNVKENSLTIGKRAIEITANAISKEYGDSDPELTYQVTSGSLAGSDILIGVLERTSGENLGDYVITQGTLGINGNYDISFVTNDFTISPRIIEVTADAKTKNYRDSEPALTYQISSGSLIGGDTFAGNLTRLPGELIGTYPITQGTLALNNNYTIVFVSNNLIIVPAVNQSIWNGSLNADWNTNANWSDTTVPAITNNAIIPSVRTTPEIETEIQINDLTIEDFATMTIQKDGAVQVDGDLMNNGGIYMMSTPVNSSSLLVKGVANGMVTYERDGLIANERNIISVPVSGQSIKEFVENPANNIQLNTSTTPNTYGVGYYDDTRAQGDKWVYYTVDDLITNSITFEKGKSYAISRETDGKITFTGTVTTTDVATAINASEWNAVGNPFTAFLPLNTNSGANFINTNSSVFDPAYVATYSWSSTQNKYVANSLVDAEVSLAPSEGFLIKAAAGANVVNFNKNQRLIQPILGGNIQNMTSVTLTARNATRSVTTDINYINGANQGLDTGYDIGNHGNAAFDVYTHLLANSTGIDFTTQSLPDSGYESMVISVGLRAVAGSEVYFSAESFNLPAGLTVFLEDIKEGTYVELKEGEEHLVNLTENEDGIGRFYLHTKSATLKTNETNTSKIKIYNYQNELFINGIVNGNLKVSLYNTTGLEVYATELKADGNNRITLPNLAAGIYIVRLNTVFGTKTKKIILK